MPARKKRKRYVHRNRADGAKKLDEQSLVAVLPRQDATISPDTSENRQVEAKVDPLDGFNVRMEWNEVRLTVARLYGRGFRRSQIARAMVEHLYPPDGVARTDEQRLIYARQKLRRWEQSQEFRDLIYRHAVVELDMQTPGILVGLAKRAKRGRVDAARLALEVTGRHSREDNSAPVSVTVNLANVARPQ